MTKRSVGDEDNVLEEHHLHCLEPPFPLCHLFVLLIIILIVLDVFGAVLARQTHPIAPSFFTCTSCPTARTAIWAYSTYFTIVSFLAMWRFLIHA